MQWFPEIFLFKVIKDLNVPEDLPPKKQRQLRKTNV